MSTVFSSAPPVVQLVNAFAEPFNNAIATARTCYASRIITAADVDKDERSRAQRDAIAESTYAAGHHTTLQHASFQFALENVSRQFIWSFLHAHPFYNSEQVSQRYVAVKPDRVLMPILPPRAAQVYAQAVAMQMQAYADLVAMLMAPAGDAYFSVFPARRKHADKHVGAIKKKAQEVARYVLPIGTFAHLYHTVTGVTLHRYHRLCNRVDVPHETALVVQAMIDAVTAHDPLFFAHIEDPIPLTETHEYQAMQATGRLHVTTDAGALCREFDAELGGSLSCLVDYSPNAEQVLARTVRHVLGVSAAQLSDDAAIARVLSPAENSYLAGALNVTTLGKLTRSLVHPYYTFQKKLSHAADSQDQRHRMTPGSRPILHTQYAGGSPDVIVPVLLQACPEAMDRYMHTMEQTWVAIDALLADNVSAEMALYLLPNAFPIRFHESGDLASMHHKWTSRLCYNAQEEIWRATVDEVQAVRRVHPRIGQYIGPPCALRRDAQLRPLCPEGSRYCGVPVWKKELNEYERVI